MARRVRAIARFRQLRAFGIFLWAEARHASSAGCFRARVADQPWARVTPWLLDRAEWHGWEQSNFAPHGRLRAGREGVWHPGVMATSSARRAILSMLTAAAIVVIPAVAAKIVRRKGQCGGRAS